MKRLFLIGVALLSFSCSPKPESKIFVNKPVKQGPASEFYELDLPVRKFNKINVEIEKLPQQLTTDAYFRLISNIIHLSQSREGEGLSSLAKKLYYSFYANQENFSKVCLDKSPYIGAALGLYKENLLKAANDNFVEIFKDTETLINGLVPKLTESQKANENPSLSFELILEYVRQLPIVFEEKSLSPMIVDELKKQIEKYLPGLNKVQNILVKLETLPQEGDQPFLNDAGEVVYILPGKLLLVQEVVGEIENLGILPVDFRQRVVQSLQLPLEVSQKIKPGVVSKDVLWTLFEIYKYFASPLGELSSEEKGKELSQKLPKDFHIIIWALKGVSLKEIEWLQSFLDKDTSEFELRDENGERSRLRELELKTRMKSLLAAIQATGYMDDYKSVSSAIDIAVAKALIAALNDELVKLYLNINGIIGKVLYQEVVRLGDSYYFDFDQQILSQALDILDQEIFLGANFFTGFESKDYLLNSVTNSSPFVNQANEKEQTPLCGKLTPKTNVIVETNAKIVASSLLANLDFLKFYENLSSAGRAEEYNYISYTIINKLLAIGGHTNARGEVLSALFRPIRNNVRFEPDIFLYHEAKGVFAVPEALKIGNNFSIIENLLQEYNVDMRGQAELLKAVSSAMIYFDSYTRNNYNRYLGDLSFMGIKVFPKTPFYDLSIGIAAMILRNLQKEGLYLFDENNKVIDLKLIKDITKLNVQVTGVAIADYSSRGTSKEIQVEDMVHFSLALGEFLKATENVEYNLGSVLNYMKDGKRVDLVNIQNARNIFRKMIVGINNFILSKHQNENFSLANSLNLETGVKSVRDPSIETYWASIRSLLLAHEQFGGLVYVWAAVDILNHINKKYFSSSVGFYRNDGKTSLYQVTEAWITLKQLRNVLVSLPAEKRSWWTPKMQEQLENLIELQNFSVEQ